MVDVGNSAIKLISVIVILDAGPDVFDAILIIPCSNNIRTAYPKVDDITLVKSTIKL